jgi:hypothetical protein
MVRVTDRAATALQELLTTNEAALISPEFDNQVGLLSGHG